MSDRLLHGHLVEILHRLGIKDVVRCTAVCKSWDSLIKSPDFIKTHLTRNGSKSPQLLFTHHSYHNFVHEYSLRICDETFNKIEDLNFPLDSVEPFRIVGSCNGVVCLCNSLEATLWNPSIRKVVNLRFDTEKIYVLYNVLGFGFDAKSNDYKVVRITYGKYPTHEAELYSLNRGSWKSIKGPNCNLVIKYHTHAFTNGASHWISEYGHSFVAFDMGDEAFREIMLAGNIPLDRHDQELMVAVFEDSLAVIQSLYNIDHQHKTCSMWVMKEYGRPESWTKLFTVVLYRSDITSVKVGEVTFYFPSVRHRRNSATEVEYYRESLALLHHDEEIKEEEKGAQT